MRRHALSLLSLVTLAAFAACSNEGERRAGAPAESAEAALRTPLEIIRTVPEAAALLDRAEPIHASSGGFALHASTTSAATSATSATNATNATNAMGTLTTTRAALDVVLPTAADGPTTLRDVGSGLSITLRRLGASSAPGHVEGSALVYDRASPGVDAVLFSRAAELEELLVVRERGASLAWDVTLPSGGSVTIAAGNVAEVRDVAGVPLLRMHADRAWDASGHETRLELSVRPTAGGARLTLRTPDAAAFPVTVDPAWSSTATPLRLRQNHTATLLATGQVLFAGGSGDTSTELFDLRSGRYTAGPAMSGARSQHAAVVLASGKVLLAGGTGLATADLYDPLTGTLTATGAMSAARAGATLTRLPSGKVLVIGGGPSTAEIYDPATGTFGAAPAKATTAHAVTVPLANGKVLIADDTVAELFDPSAAGGVGAFTSTGTPKTAAGWQTATLLRDNRVLLTGNTGCFSTGGPPTCTPAANTYDATSGTFANVTADRGRYSAEATLMPSGKVLVSGGVATVSLFDPTTNTWASGGDMENARGGHTSTLLPGGDVLLLGGSVATVNTFSEDGVLLPTAGPSLLLGHTYPGATLLLDDRILVAGGATGTTDAELVDLAASKTTKTTGAMKSGHDGHTQTLLPSGKVLLAGGSGTGAELFDPSTSTFTATGAMAIARSHATATLLPNGKVLVAGGTSSKTAELYDESTGTFGTAGTMVDALSGHGAVLLADGRVLLEGRTSAQIYDPKAGTFTATATSGTPRDAYTANALANGKVLIGGGPTLAADVFDPVHETLSFSEPVPIVLDERVYQTIATGQVAVFGGSTNIGEVTYAQSDLFDPYSGDGRGAFRSLPAMPTALVKHATTMTAGGGAFVVGGNPCGAICVSPDNLVTSVFHDHANAAWRPKISTLDKTVTPGTLVTVTGTGFHPSTEGAGGTASSSTTNTPIAFWVPAASRATVIGRLESFTDTTVQWRVPATAYAGKGRLFVWSAGALSNGAAVEIAEAPSGAACTYGGECGSGFCVDGVCCDRACTGVCEACSAARKTSGVDGTCGAIPPGKDSRGLCVLGQGAGCKADAECGTGHCVDGACCDSACTGQCESCAVTGSVGTCVAVLGPPKGSRAACAAAPAGEPCKQAQCDGLERTKCNGFVDATTVCQKASCTAGVATLAANCDGKGACAAAAPLKCEPFACGETSCLKACAGSSECATGYRCADGKCVTGAVCDGYHTVETPGAPPSDCTPFTCEGDHCRSSCTASSDCVAGFVCDESGLCVTPGSTGDAGSSGGCALDGDTGEGGGRGGAVAAMLLALVVTAGVSRRRKG